MFIKLDTLSIVGYKTIQNFHNCNKKVIFFHNCLQVLINQGLSYSTTPCFISNSSKIILDSPVYFAILS